MKKYIAILLLPIFLIPGTSFSAEFEGESGYYCTTPLFDDASVCEKGDVILTNIMNALKWCDISQPITTAPPPQFGPKARKIICVHRGKPRIWREEADFKANLPTKRQQRKEADLRAKLQAEENQRSSNTQREAYKLALLTKVKRNWIRPAGSEKITECWVEVLQGAGGIILDVTFDACKGSTGAYRSSIENAVYKAEPLPKPGDPSLFERELKFNFKPE